MRDRVVNTFRADAETNGHISEHLRTARATFARRRDRPLRAHAECCQEWTFGYTPLSPKQLRSHASEPNANHAPAAKTPIASVAV